MRDAAVTLPSPEKPVQRGPGSWHLWPRASLFPLVASILVPGCPLRTWACGIDQGKKPPPCSVKSITQGALARGLGQEVRLAKVAQEALRASVSLPGRRFREGPSTQRGQQVQGLGDWVLEPCWAVGVRGRYRLVSRSGAGPASQLGDLRKRSLLSWPCEPHSDPELCGQRYSIYSGEAQEDVGRRVP